MTDTAVLVTRPAGQSLGLCQRLSAEGLRVVEQPMLTLQPLQPLPKGSHAAVLQLDSFQHIIFISANAVHFGFDAIGDYWPQLPVGIHWYAIGERTAALVGEQGVDVLSPGQEMTSEGLLRLPSLQSVSGEKVLIVRGKGGRQTLRDTLLERGANVSSLVCYRRSPPEISPQELAQQLSVESVAAVVLTSGEGLANFTRLRPPGETTNLTGLTLVVPSARVAQEARELGWQQVLTARNASDDAMAETVLAWRDNKGMHA